MCDDIDLEDLECRLYSQVFHANVDEELNLLSETNVTFHSNGKANYNRYFSKGSSKPVFISLENKDDNRPERICSPLYNNFSFESTSTNIITEEYFSSHFQNNDTFNQYTGQFILNSNENLIYPQSRKHKKQLIRRSQRVLRRRQGRRNNTIVQIRPRVDHFIFISDESDSECVVVNDMHKKPVSTKDIPKPNTFEYIESDSDNEIIYVPPPPVEVIDVDADAGEKITCENIQEVSDLTVLPNQTEDPEKCSEELSNTPESCSNDFLDNSGIENNSSKFNFGLHGSDFNNTSDFLRPADPVEHCETESSCSTNDLNRDNNSVKTIVFNEVDFPKEDIFSEKNLEGFSSYITPKRNSSKPSKSSTKTSSENKSSSESDYEISDIVNKNIKRLDLESNKRLPTLSPMQDDQTTPTSAKLEIKSQKSKIQSASHTKNGSKRKSNTLENTESDSDNNGNSKSVKKLLKKKKRTSRQKRASSEESDEITQTQNKDNNDPCNEENINSSVSDSLIHEENEEFNDTVNKNAMNIITNIKTYKKKKKNYKKFEVDNTEISTSNDFNTEKAKRKKRKSVSSESALTSDVINDELNWSALEIADISNTIASNVKDNSATSMDEEQPDSTCGSSEGINKLKRRKKKSISEHLVDDAVKSNELNESALGNEISNINSAANDNRNTKSKVEVDDETRNNETLNSKEQLANDKDANKTASKDVPRNVKENESELLPSSINALEGIDNKDIIVIDETVSSSESDVDFVNLRDVGQDLKLANCGVKDNLAPTEEINNIDDFTSFYVTNDNICEFDVQQIQSTQTDDPEAWKISPSDGSLCWELGRKKGPRCSRCRQFGHIAVRCTEKLFPKCTLCGFQGHQEPRCPNKRCYHCGNKGDYSTMYCWKCVKFRNSICRICKMKGHIAKTCPDLWRRYHLTTQEGPIVVSEKPQLKPRDQLWCSGCAKQGHLEHECEDLIRQYPPINPCIISYEDVLPKEDRDVLRKEDTDVLHKEDKNKNFNDVPATPSVPIISAPQQNNFLTSSSSIFSATSQNLPYSSPMFIPLVSPMPNDNSIISFPAILNHNQTLVQNNISHNLSVSQPPTKVLTPFTVLVNLNQMMLDYVNDHKTKYLGIYQTQNRPFTMMQSAKDFIKKDQMKVRKIIMFMHPDVVHQFLINEMADLENVVSKSDPKYLKQKLIKYDQIVRSKKVLHCDLVRESCFWYRILNMFIFGVHLCKNGENHVNYIKMYISELKERGREIHIRKRLLNAYNYIFDPTPHENFSYHKIMRQLIQSYRHENE